jgi:hypothetical protein
VKPRTGRRTHLTGMAFWGAQMLGSPLLIGGWRLYLLEISQYANFVGHWSGFSAERPSEVTEQ